jgi:hypothetical protein
LKFHSRLKLANSKRAASRSLRFYYRVVGLMMRLDDLNPNTTLNHLILDSRYGDFTDVTGLKGLDTNWERVLARQVGEGLWASALN